jgi:hypothetical protein
VVFLSVDPTWAEVDNHTGILTVRKEIFGPLCFSSVHSKQLGSTDTTYTRTNRERERRRTIMISKEEGRSERAKLYYKIPNYNQDEKETLSALRLFFI